MNKLEKILAQTVTSEMVAEQLTEEEDVLEYRTTDYVKSGFFSDVLTGNVKRDGFKITGDTKAKYEEDKK